MSQASTDAQVNTYANGFSEGAVLRGDRFLRSDRFPAGTRLGFDISQAGADFSGRLISQSQLRTRKFAYERRFRGRASSLLPVPQGLASGLLPEPSRTPLTGCSFSAPRPASSTGQPYLKHGVGRRGLSEEGLLYPRPQPIKQSESLHSRQWNGPPPKPRCRAHLLLAFGPECPSRGYSAGNTHTGSSLREPAAAR